MKNKTIVSLLMVMLLAVSLAGCGGKKNSVEYGTYTSQDESMSAYPPTVALFEDGTYQFNLVVGSYFAGTYQVKDDTLTLTMDNNASKFADDVIKELTFTIDADAKEITIEQELPELVASGTIFKL